MLVEDARRLVEDVEVVHVQLALDIVRFQNFGCLEAEEPLSPADFFSGTNKQETRQAHV